MQNRRVPRDKQLPVMVSDEEYDAIQETARKQDRSMGAMIRMLCKAEAARLDISWPEQPPRAQKSTKKPAKRKA